MGETISKRVMRRVYTVYYLRKVLNPITVKSAILAMGALGFGALVHVAAIFENLPALSDISGLYSFSYEAFANTDITVQAIVALSMAVVFWLTRDIMIRLLRRDNTPVYAHA